MKQVVWISLLFIALVLAGCKSGPNIVGKWDMGSTEGLTLPVEFKADKTFSGTAMEGTWSQSDKTVTLTLTKVMGMDVAQFQQKAQEIAKQMGSKTPENADMAKLVLTVSEDGQTMSGPSPTGREPVSFKREKSS